MEISPKYPYSSFSFLSFETDWDAGRHLPLAAWDSGIHLGPINAPAEENGLVCWPRAYLFNYVGIRGIMTSLVMAVEGAIQQRLPNSVLVKTSQPVLQHPVCLTHPSLPACKPLVHLEDMGSFKLFWYQGQEERWESDSGTNGWAPQAPGRHPGLWTHSMVRPFISFSAAFANPNIWTLRFILPYSQRQTWAGALFP